MQMQHALDYVEAVVAEAAEHGVVSTPGGARLIGRVPAVAPEAYLHNLFPPLDDEEIEALVAGVGRPLPEKYRALLRRTNGLNLFGASLSIYGLRTRDHRSGPERYPYSAAPANTVERPPQVPPAAVVIGSYGEDGSKVYIDPPGGVVRCDRDTGIALNDWRDLAEMLTSEVGRMTRQIDYSQPLGRSAWYIPPPAGEPAAPPDAPHR